MTMGTYIKQLRKEMGISQEELGKPLNIPVNKITEKRKYPGTSSEEFWKGCCEGLGNVLWNESDWATESLGKYDRHDTTSKVHSKRFYYVEKRMNNILYVNFNKSSRYLS